MYVVWCHPGVIPYLPYSRQSKLRNRGCITAKLLASMMTKAGMCTFVLCMCTLELKHSYIVLLILIP